MLIYGGERCRAQRRFYGSWNKTSILQSLSSQESVFIARKFPHKSTAVAYRLVQC